MRKPKISIVTPAFNSGKFIRETIESVLSQDYDNFEYFVIDGGSTDQTIEILKEYSAKKEYKDVFRWISEKDEGQTDAINKGLCRCSGDWFAFLNADDYFYPNVFSKLLLDFQQYCDKGVLYGNCTMLYHDHPQKKNYFASHRYISTLN